MRYILGSNARVAKFAARILVASKDHDELCAEVVEVSLPILIWTAHSPLVFQSIAEKLSTAQPELLVAHTAVLAQFARLAPDAFERKSDVLMTFLIKKLLMVPSPPDPVRSDITFDRGEFTEISRYRMRWTRRQTGWRTMT
jgi:sister-chromatid-cohesion protein PDS5